MEGDPRVRDGRPVLLPGQLELVEGTGVGDALGEILNLKRY